MAAAEYLISPSEGPFKLYAWLELSFPLAIDITHTFHASYTEGISTEVEIEISSSYYRVATGNRWQYDQEMEQWAAQARAGDIQPRPSGSMPEYIPENNLKSRVAQIEMSKPRYVHVERVPAVALVSTKIPGELVPEEDFSPYGLGPDNKFFSEEVALMVNSILDAYRIAAYPWMRYSITPVSEALADQALVVVASRTGEFLSYWIYGYDVRSPSHINYLPKPSSTKINGRFGATLSNITNLQAENQMASAYYLFRMQRLAEAVAVASSVVDNLQRELVFSLASTKIEAEAIWKAFRYQQQFKKVFPAFGKPKLSDTNPTLWESFVSAKKYRGAAIHGSFTTASPISEQKIVRQHLQAFDAVARWLKTQMGSTWELDMSDNEEQLISFP